MKIYRTNEIITRDRVRNHPQNLYLFGDNTLRRGTGGQAKEMRGEPNTLGIVTKRYPSNKEDSFFTDDLFFEWLSYFSHDIKILSDLINHDEYEAVIIPPMGTGLADLPNCAPKIYKYLKTALDNL